MEQNKLIESPKYIAYYNHLRVIVTLGRVPSVIVNESVGLLFRSRNEHVDNC